MSFQLQDATLADQPTLSRISYLANLDNPYGQLVWKRVSPEERATSSYARFPQKLLAIGSWMVKLQEGEETIAYAEWTLPPALCKRMRAEKPLIVSQAEREQFVKDYAATVDEDDWPLGTDREIPNAVSPLMREGRRQFPADGNYIYRAILGLWSKFALSIHALAVTNQLRKQMEKDLTRLLDELKTLPEHRRRGAGSKLLQWGLDLADREKFNICLIAMPLGLEPYEKDGFERLHEVSVDLSKYGGDTTFTWVFILRKPRA